MASYLAKATHLKKCVFVFLNADIALSVVPQIQINTNRIQKLCKTVILNNDIISSYYT